MTAQKYVAVAFAFLLICAECSAEEKGSPAASPVNDGSKASTSDEPASPFKCQIELFIGDQSIPLRTFFSSHYAIEFEPEHQEQVAAVYDLDAMSWRDFAPARTVQIKDCEAWSRKSAEMTRKSLAKVADAKLRRFVELSLDPKFDVTGDSDTVTFRNDVMTYKTSDPMSLNAAQRKYYFSYDRLNAYRKAMADRKLGPFPQLAVDDELESRKFAPGTIALTIKTPNGEVDLTVKAQISPLNPEEAKVAAEAIRRANAASE